MAKLYANLYLGSKYASQATSVPFSVDLRPDSEGFIFSGNDNHYRSCDLIFFVKEENAYVALQEEFGELLLRSLGHIIQWAESFPNDHGSQSLLYQTGATSQLREKLEHLVELFPEEDPMCPNCRNYGYQCYCL